MDEQSAAESDNRQCATPQRCFWPHCCCRTLTEARMLELARETEAFEFINCPAAKRLAALVIETFGKDSQP